MNQIWVFIAHCEHEINDGEDDEEDGEEDFPRIEKVPRDVFVARVFNVEDFQGSEKP